MISWYLTRNNSWRLKTPANVKVGGFHSKSSAMVLLPTLFLTNRLSLDDLTGFLDLWSMPRVIFLSFLTRPWLHKVVNTLLLPPVGILWLQCFGLSFVWPHVVYTARCIYKPCIYSHVYTSKLCIYKNSCIYIPGHLYIQFFLSCLCSGSSRIVVPLTNERWFRLGKQYSCYWKTNFKRDL